YRPQQSPRALPPPSGQNPASARLPARMPSQPRRSSIAAGSGEFLCSCSPPLRVKFRGNISILPFMSSVVLFDFLWDHLHFKAVSAIPAGITWKMETGLEAGAGRGGYAGDGIDQHP